MKILFFIEALDVGGRERRFVELIVFLRRNTNYDLKIVIMNPKIHFKEILKYKVPIEIIERGSFKKDPFIFYKFYNIIKKNRPDIIHTWNGMTTFYSIPSAKYFRIPIINSQISDTFKKEYRTYFRNFTWRINKHYSDYVMSNSKTGLMSYNVKSGSAIYNGIRLERFINLKNIEEVKLDFGIKTKYLVVMLANFNKNKDYALFYNIAEEICNNRDDVTFIGAGSGAEEFIANYIGDSEIIANIKFIEKISNVENLINVSDIGVLFSNQKTGEGISNSILEYMALSKPVIATNAGASFEVIDDKVSGYLVNNNVKLIS